jgi:hypothetical protein
MRGILWVERRDQPASAILSVECSDSTVPVLSHLIQSYAASCAQWWTTYGAFILVCLTILTISSALYLLWRLLPARGPIACVAILSLSIWAAIGDPIQTMADWLWPRSPAPWGSGDAIYYPDKANQLVSVDNQDVGSLTRCRAWVISVAKQSDPRLQRGDYQCGVGYRSSAGLNIYRMMVR